MSAIYGEVLRRIQDGRPGDKELAMRILSWLFRAQRALSMGELLEALTVEDCEADDRLEEALQEGIAPVDVIDSCKSLVQYEKSSGLVRFSHYTVQEFVADHIQELPHALHLARSCLTYLILDDFEEFRPEVRSFRGYATQFWDAHTREAEESLVIQRAAQRLLTSPEKLKLIVRFGSEAGLWEYSNQTPLHVVAEKGLGTICKLILEMKTIKHFLQSTDQSGYTPLQVAASNGHGNVVEVLLAAGADANIQSNVGETALHIAARCGYSSVVRILLKASADVHLKDNDGYTALHAAASRGHHEVIKILLEARADAGMQDDEGQTALHTAASHSHENVVKTLFYANADLNVRDSSGRTPLHLAASHGHNTVIGIFLAAGADWSISDSAGKTALSAGVWNGDKKALWISHSVTFLCV